MFFVSILFVFSQNDPKMAVGLGPEINMNSRENFALGVVLGFNYNLASSYAVGVTIAASNNLSGISVIEPAALFRWYFLGRESGWFAQADAGGYFVFEDGEISTLFMAGLKGGLRMPFGTRFYIEPHLRVGYPFLFGIGAMAGMKF